MVAPTQAATVQFNVINLFGHNPGNDLTSAAQFSSQVDIGALSGDLLLSGTSFDLTLRGVESNGSTTDVTWKDSTDSYAPGAGTAGSQEKTRWATDEEMNFTFSNFDILADNPTVQVTDILVVETYYTQSSNSDGKQMDYWLNNGTVTNGMIHASDGTMALTGLSIEEDDVLNFKYKGTNYARLDYKLLKFEVQYEIIPEPSSAALLGLGAMGLLMRRRK